MLNTLLKQVKEYKKSSLLSPIFVGIEVIFEMLIPFLMSKIIDLGVEKNDMKMIIFYGSLMLMLLVVLQRISEKRCLRIFRIFLLKILISILQLV